MNKQFFFLVIGFLSALSVSSQSVNRAINSEALQLTKQLSNNLTRRNFIANNFLQTESTQNEIQQLDSIIHYDYDEEHEEWDMKTYKISIFYDKGFNDTTILQSTWDKTNNSWIIRTKEVKQYNENNMILSHEFYLVSKSGKRIEYTYNENDDLTEIKESFLNADNWQYKTRNVYSYNSKNLLQTDTLYQRFTISGMPVWHEVGITSFYYNAGESIVADTTYSRSWLNGNNFSEWKLYSRTDYETKEDARVTTSFSWNSDSNKFNPKLKELILYYNVNKDIGVLIDFKWNSGLSLWDTITMTQYQYSEDDYMISNEKLSLENSRSKVQEIFDFDYDISNNELVLPTSALDVNSKIAFHHKINTRQSMRYDYNTNENQKFRETKYYYSTINKNPSTLVKVTPQATVQIHPNPASEFIIINGSDSFSKVWFELFDINGIKVFSKAVNKCENINISNLNEGLYIYSIWDNGQKNIGKLIIK